MESRDFEAYLSWAFDRPLPSPGEGHWYEQADDIDILWTGERAILLFHLIRIFENPQVAFGRFTRSQVGQGLWFLSGAPGYSHLWTALDADVPLPEIEKLIAAMGDLFEKGFSPNVTGPIEKTGDPVDQACWMWFDFCDDWASETTASKRVTRDDAFLNVLRRVLFLPSNDCQMAALHGLGHWHEFRAEEPAAIIDAWLAAEPRELRLLRYAHKVRAGHVP